MSIRLLPLLVIVSLLLLVVKMTDIFRHDAELSALFLVAESAAVTEKPEALKPAQTSKEEAAGPAPQEEKPATSVPQFSAAELEILQNLQKRREVLEAREKNLGLQANVLKATEAKIDEKAAQLAALQTQVVEILKEYNQKEDKKIKSLVKIYENMKPKEAAVIFEAMDMPILLEVVGHMKEVKAAPVLAKMDPKKAKELTTALADRRRLPEVDNRYKE